MQDNDTTRPTFITLGPKAKDLTGQRFGRLVALGPVERTKRMEIKWLCLCDCGKTTTTIGNLLRSRRTKSCGCLYQETTKSGSNHRTHGLSKTPLFRIWAGIITRCTNPKATGYKNWGARGISMCDEWYGDFQAFHDYVTNLPNYETKGYTLDRIDNNAGYFPGNLRYATSTEQNRNKRNVRMITYDGKTQCMPAWAKELGIPRRTLSDRLSHGWPVEKALMQALRVWPSKQLKSK